jgi:hypothetical protein
MAATPNARNASATWATTASNTKPAHLVPPPDLGEERHDEQDQGKERHDHHPTMPWMT